MKARYLLNIANGELFGWCAEWTKYPGFVEYDPELHGYRSEVAAVLGLVADTPKADPVDVAAGDPSNVVVTEAVAGADTKQKRAAKPPKAADPIDDLFGAK